MIYLSYKTFMGGDKHGTNQNYSCSHRAAKKTTLANNLYYDNLEIHDSKVVGYLDGQQTMSWYFKDFKGVDTVKASLSSQFAQVVFLTGLNSKNRVVGVDLGMTQNLNALRFQI